MVSSNYYGYGYRYHINGFQATSPNNSNGYEENENNPQKNKLPIYEPAENVVRWEELNHRAIYEQNSVRSVKETKEYPYIVESFIHNNLGRYEYNSLDDLKKMCGMYIDDIVIEEDSFFKTLYGDKEGVYYKITNKLLPGGGAGFTVRVSSNNPGVSSNPVIEKHDKNTDKNFSYIVDEFMHNKLPQKEYKSMKEFIIACGDYYQYFEVEEDITTKELCGGGNFYKVTNKLTGARDFALVRIFNEDVEETPEHRIQYNKPIEENYLGKWESLFYESIGNVEVNSIQELENLCGEQLVDLDIKLEKETNGFDVYIITSKLGAQGSITYAIKSENNKNKEIKVQGYESIANNVYDLIDSIDEKSIKKQEIDKIVDYIHFAKQRTMNGMSCKKEMENSINRIIELCASKGIYITLTYERNGQLNIDVWY